MFVSAPPSQCLPMIYEIDDAFIDPNGKIYIVTELTGQIPLPNGHTLCFSEGRYKGTEVPVEILEIRNPLD